jgi:hypothetical protein
MYPVDLLKVLARGYELHWTRQRVLMHNADTNANHKSFGRRTLHRAFECGINNLQD